jgi:prevent-host-death family protein
MPKKSSIAEAKDRLTQLIRDVERGTPVEITRRGKPVAVLVSIEQYQRLAQGRPNFWEELQGFRQSHSMSDADVDAVFADVRDRTSGRDVDL